MMPFFLLISNSFSFLQSAKPFLSNLPVKSSPVATRVIASSYFLEETPSEQTFSETAEKLQDTGADIVKIVTEAKDISDNKRLFNLLATTKVLNNAILV